MRTADLLGEKYTIEAQILCVRRELAMRKKVYPDWVSSRKMKAEQAEHQINCMQAVHDTLTAIKDGTAGTDTIDIPPTFASGAGP